MSQQEFMPESQEQIKQEQSPDEGIQHSYPHVWPKQKSNMPKYEHPANYEEEDIPPYSYRAQDQGYRQTTSKTYYTAQEGPKKQESPRSYNQYQQQHQQRQQPYWGWMSQKQLRCLTRPNRSIGRIFPLIVLGIIFLPIILKVMEVAVTVLLGFLFFSFFFVGIVAILLFFIWRNVLRNLMRW